MTARYDLIEVAAQAMRALDYDEPWEYAHEAIRVAYRTEAAAGLDAVLAHPSLLLEAMGGDASREWSVVCPNGTREKAWWRYFADPEDARLIAAYRDKSQDHRKIFGCKGPHRVEWRVVGPWTEEEME